MNHHSARHLPPVRLDTSIARLRTKPDAAMGVYRETMRLRRHAQRSLNDRKHQEGAAPGVAALSLV